MYFGVRSLLAGTEFGRRLEVVSVDMTDLSAVEQVCRNCTPGLVWIETPSNPLVSVVDIAAVAEIARTSGAAVGVDNTWATPVLQQPLTLGADIVVHSLTKYVGGHSDVMAGVVVVKEDGRHLQELRAIQRYRGVLPSPFDCWLALRGVASLSARMTTHCSNALTLARYLEAHPSVAVVHYPGLPSHAGHMIAGKQMRNFGGMLSMEVRGGSGEAMIAANALRLVTRATSLGGNHSLVEHRASVEGLATQAPESLLKVSVGLEHVDDLITDFDQALRMI